MEVKNREKCRNLCGYSDLTETAFMHVIFRADAAYLRRRLAFSTESDIINLIVNLMFRDKYPHAPGTAADKKLQMGETV